MKRKNNALWWVTGGALLGLALVLGIPVLRTLFRFSPLTPLQLLECSAVVFAMFLIFELLKYLLNSKARRSSASLPLAEAAA